jgi:ABC-type spermidine/putrescine transport system permease subunit II
VHAAEVLDQQQTLPIWLYSQMLRPRNRPITNVTAMLIVPLTTLPMLFARRLIARRSGEESGQTQAAAGCAGAGTPG